VHIQRFTEDGVSLLRVPLYGKHAAGRSFVIDEATWLEGRKAGWPAAWILVNEPKVQKHYVSTCTKPLSNGRGAVSLARIVKQAGPGEVVQFADGNTLNFRPINLVKFCAVQAAQKRGGGQRGWCPPWHGATEEFADEQADGDVPW
jgi:hypothetical protein